MPGSPTRKTLTKKTSINIRFDLFSRNEPSARYGRILLKQNPGINPQIKETEYDSPKISL